ncbi:hypothetical protein [Bacillus infantis]|uniref:hypothetical protein n=1 Tax=Bacillus infantis TaxID=324767 RepID=UPI003CF40999
MSNFFYLELDTTPVSNPTITIDGGATYATNQLVTISIGTSDSSTVGYSMLLWGSVDSSYDVNVQSSEEESKWISFNNSKQIKLSNGDGQKTVYLKIRDDVHNASSQVSDSINLDTSVATISVTNPDKAKISEQPTKNIVSFTFTSDKAFVEYKVKLVSATTSLENAGDTIPTTAGSTNTSGIGNFPSGTPISVQIHGTDLKTVAGGDRPNNPYVIKVFVKDASGKWSA